MTSANVLLTLQYKLINMNLGNYIRALLPEHDTVVIPGMGAFVSTYKPAQVDEQSGKMLPPSKEVSFEPKIKNNDGLLAGKIAEDEGIPFTEAYRVLESEREEMLYKLDKGEQVTLENMGELSYNQKQEIQFTSAGRNFLLLDAYGLEPISLKDEPEDIPEEGPLMKNNIEKNDSEDPFKEEVPVAYEGASLKDTENPPTKRRRIWWLLLFLIPLLAAVIYIITKDTAEPPSTVDITVEEPSSAEIIPPTDTVTEDTTPVQEGETETASVEITDSTGFISPDTSKYYLIRGSFEEFENAHKYFNRLKSEGYEPFHLGKHGSFYLVGIDVFDNPIVAYGQQYNYLDKYPESGVWIFIPGQNNNLTP